MALRSGRRSIPAWTGQPVTARLSRASCPVYPRVDGAAHDRRNREAQRQVYPRVDGAAGVWLLSGPPHRGLSPRGRGSRPRPGMGRDRRGSIPAWTGQPTIIAWCMNAVAVYPRVDGAALEVHGGGRSVGGLSPRGRGSPAGAVHSPRPRRSIPAWTGQPSRSLSRDPWRRRSIPAWTGQPRSRAQRPRPAPVYPRVDGAARCGQELHPIQAGLSPRGRDSQKLAFRRRIAAGSIPAWTGQPPLTT